MQTAELEAMTVVQLRKLAKENGVKLSAGIDKAGIVGRLAEALGEEKPAAPIETATDPETEKEAALPLYRCLKPLWFTRVEALKDAGNDAAAIQQCLDDMERAQTQNIDFRSAMEG